MNTTQQCDFCKQGMEGGKRPFHKDCYDLAVGLFLPLSAMQQEIEQLERELAEKSEQVLHIDHACWYCANPDIEDPWRHEHEPDGPHWHHCIDPGDGLPSSCANSDRLERIFGEKEAELIRLRSQVEQKETEVRTYYSMSQGQTTELTQLREALTRIIQFCKQSIPNIAFHEIRIAEAELHPSPSKPEDV